MSKFGEYCLLITKGTTPTTIGEAFTDEGVNFIKIEAISDDGVLNESMVAHISESTHAKMSRSALEEEDILISIAGNLGRIALVTKTMLPANVNQAVAIVRLNKKLTYPLFVFYYLRLNSSQYKLKHANAQSVQQNINLDNIKNLEVDFPDYQTQKKIADSISKCDYKIFNNNAIISDLEWMAKFLYDYWFVQFDFPDENGKPYKSSGGKMVWNEELKREIPEGWEVHSAADYLTVTKGVSYSSSDLLGDGIKMLNLNSFNENGTYKVEGIKSFSGRVPKGRTVNANDLLMCVTQQTDIDLTGKRNVIGKTILAPNLGYELMTMSMDVVRLSSPDIDLIPFFKFAFGLPYVHKYIVGYANGTKIKHLNVDGALSVPIALPPRSMQIVKAFSEIAININNKISSIIVENQQLTALRDFLLPMLMNGQVKVGKA